MSRIPTSPLLVLGTLCPLLLPVVGRAASPAPAPSRVDVPVPTVWTEPPEAVSAAAVALRGACAGWSPRVPRPPEEGVSRPRLGEPPEAAICETALDPLGRADTGWGPATGAALAAACIGLAHAAFAAARGLLGLPRRALRRAVARRRGVRLAARHEAAHALVAAVLDLPFDHARVFLDGGGGYGRFPAEPAWPDPSFHSFLVYRTAMLVAGVAGESPGAPPAAFLERMEGQRDWPRALEASYLAEALWPGRRVLEPVIEEVVAVLRTPGWQAALREMADALSRARGGEIGPEVFVAAARRHGLSLSGARALASAPSSGDAGEAGRPGGGPVSPDGDAAPGGVVRFPSRPPLPRRSGVVGAVGRDLLGGA